MPDQDLQCARRRRAPMGAAGTRGPPVVHGHVEARRYRWREAGANGARIRAASFLGVICAPPGDNPLIPTVNLQFIESIVSLCCSTASRRASTHHFMTLANALLRSCGMSSSAAHFAWIPASTPARHSDQSEAPQPPSPEQLYSALDGREVEVLGKRHRVEVYSVRDEIGRRWVQLAL